MLIIRSNDRTWQSHTSTRTHIQSFLTLPPTAQVHLPDSSPPVARQHVPRVDTHLPSGFSALNLVLIANWVGEQADTDWMRSRQSRLWLWPLRQLSLRDVRRNTSEFSGVQKWTNKLILLQAGMVEVKVWVFKVKNKQKNKKNLYFCSSVVIYLIENAFVEYNKIENTQDGLYDVRSS